MLVDTPAARAAIVAAALAWDGTPYHHQGRVLGVGVDCGQLLVATFIAVGVLPADFSIGDYAPSWWLNTGEEWYLDTLRRFSREIEPAAARAGDVLAWRFGRAYSHAAILLTDDPRGEILHALGDVGCVRGRADDEIFINRPPRAFTAFGVA